MKTKRNEDKTELVTICQFQRSYNSVILDKWELKDLAELLNIIIGEENYLKRKIIGDENYLKRKIVRLVKFLNQFSN